VEELSKYEVDSMSTEIPEEVKEMGSFVPKSYSLAAYVNRSPLLQEFIKLGVNLSEWEKQKGVPDMIVMKDFDNDIRPYIKFLCDLGVPAEELGRLFTKAPMIFEQDLEDLQVRINYLKAKRFTDDAIATIILKQPAWLTCDVRNLDGRIGFIQRWFHLTGNEVRHVVTRTPKIVFWMQGLLKEVQFSVTEEMGFTKEEAKQILLEVPKIYTQNRMMLVSVFDYLHNTMGIPHSMMLTFPQCFRTRLFKFQQRHQYLVYLGKARYDPLKPGFVPLKRLCLTTDTEFCTEIAKTTIEDFNDFLKTL
jgi:mTERF domain-containing protein